MENETNINTTISALMSKSQTALDNSNTSINLQLVHSLQVDYTEQVIALQYYLYGNTMQVIQATVLVITKVTQML